MAIGQPGFFTQNPDGTVTAEFAGHVSAAGIDILAADSSTPAADRRITWHKSVITGAQIAALSAYNDSAANLSFADFTIGGFTVADDANISLKANSNSRQAGLFVTQRHTADNALSAVSANVDNGTTQATIIAGDASGRGSSSFLRFGSLNPQRVHTVNYGQTAYNWPGGTTLVALGGILHGLGVIPQIVLAMGHTGGSSGGGVTFSVNAAASTTTQFFLQAHTFKAAPAAGGDALYWLAIG